jgi:hypothetical protein
MRHADIAALRCRHAMLPPLLPLRAVGFSPLIFAILRYITPLRRYFRH